MTFYGRMKIINGYLSKEQPDGSWLTVQHGINPYLVTPETPKTYVPPVIPKEEPKPTKYPIIPKSYWISLGYNSSQASILEEKSVKYDLKNRPDQIHYFLGTTPSVVTPPIVTPPVVTEEQYVMDIKAPVNPNLPSFIVGRLTSIVAKGGWELVSIEKTDEGYHLNLIKKGSVSVAAIAGIIVAVLILFGIVGWTITRVSDNKKEIAVAKSKQEYAQIVTDYSITTGEDLTDVINDINSAFPEEPPVSSDGIMKGLGSIFENLPLLIGGIMVITLVQTLKK